MKDFVVKGFCVDRNLGYLIQNITKDSTQEIVSYFYGISKFVIDEHSKKSSASGWTTKDIILFYKETPVSYRLQIRCSPPKSENPRAIIIVKFPNTAEDFKVDDLITSIVESGLGLTDETNMPAFNKPDLKTPACLKQVRISQNTSR